MLFSASDKAKLFAENFSKNSNLDDSAISLPSFPSSTNLKLHISVTLKMVKKVIMNLDLPKASGPDYIPVEVLKNCKPELSYICDALRDFGSVTTWYLHGRSSTCEFMLTLCSNFESFLSVCMG